MRQLLLKGTTLILSVIFLASIFAHIAAARGRSGSRRVYSGHGKGSHYVGGK